MIDNVFRILHLNSLRARVVFIFACISVVISTFYYVAYSISDHILVSSLFITIFGMILSIAFAIGFAKRIHQLLFYLNKGMQVAKEGNYETILNVSPYEHNCNEAKQLVHNFQQMIEQVQRREEELGQLCYLDSLTELANRRAFEDFYQKVWLHSYKNQYPLSIALIDIDRFKTFNDLYGHQAGDYCLKAVSETIRKVVKDVGGFVARYGGEEFVVILPHIDHCEAMKIAEKIRHRIARLVIPNVNKKGKKVCVSVSVGVTSTNILNKNNKDFLFTTADEALYEAKWRGRNLVVLSSGYKQFVSYTDKQCE